MSNLYQRLALIILLVGGISGAVIYFTVDIHTLRNVTAVEPKALVMVFVMLAIGMYFDSKRLLHLVQIAGQRITLFQAVQVIFSNYFLALLTPGAAGGAVAQLMFLRRAGIPTGIATVIVVIRTVMSLLVMFVALPFVFMNDPDTTPLDSSPVIGRCFFGSAWLPCCRQLVFAFARLNEADDANDKAAETKSPQTGI